MTSKRDLKCDDRVMSKIRLESSGRERDDVINKCRL